MDLKQLIQKIAEKNKLTKQLVQKGAPLVGIFWVDPAIMEIELALAEPVEAIELEPGSEFITGPHGHSAVWTQYKRNGLLPEKWKNQDYEYVPRGRVLFDIKKKRFKVFSSQELAKSRWFQEGIIKEFKLHSSKTAFFGDDRYEVPLEKKIGRFKNRQAKRIILRMDGIVIIVIINTLEDLINFIIFSSFTYSVIWVFMKFNYFKTPPKFTVLY